MRCDVAEWNSAVIQAVSIHTPTWGVTFVLQNLYLSTFVSIHTPTWGVTVCNRKRTYQYKFQSTHLHEVWQLLGTNSSTGNEFQSTHLHEVWPGYTIIELELACFNPHTYMRCDIGGMTQYIEFDVSIHTPTWGVTVASVISEIVNVVSIHTPTWGVTFVGS